MGPVCYTGHAARGLMRRIRNIWKGMFDVRPGEAFRAFTMAFYLLAVLFAYYILKPVSRAMFLGQFEIDKLPYLYILIAAFGGVMATLYSRVAVRTSLNAAVFWATAVSVGSLAAFWVLFRFKLPWLLYVFNIWVSLFGIVLVSQGWLVAANIFNTREAKRLYGLVGLGAVVGAWFGSGFTKFTVKQIGPENLVLASGVLVLVAYAAFLLVAREQGASLSRARGAESGEGDFSAKQMIYDIRGHRHLQVITAMVILTFIVDVMIEYQLQAAAKLTYEGKDRIAAFLGTYFFYQNIVTFVLQSLLTGAILQKLGVGGALRLAPVAISVASLGSFFSPGIISASVTRLTEAASRYTFNRAGMEVLYLPLPTELRNRTKAFIDIAVDRFGRGVGGMILVLLTSVGLTDLRYLPLVVIAFSVGWVLLSTRAQGEYIRTVRKRLEARRLDFESIRISVKDRGVLALVEQAARGSSPRQACYALSLLAEAEGYGMEPLLLDLATSPVPDVRAEIYRLALSCGFPGVVDQAWGEIRSSSQGDSSVAIVPAVGYILRFSPDPADEVTRFLEHPNPLVTEGALLALSRDGEFARDAVTREWLSRSAEDANPERRRLAAIAIGSCGDEGTEALFRLLEDPDPQVVTAACRAAGRLANRAYVHVLVPLLADARVRAEAIQALASYGAKISGTLGDILEDDSAPVAVRRQIPRVLRAVPGQRTVDILLRSIGQPNLVVRAAALKGLNRLRAANPELDYGNVFVTRQILNEARRYFELSAALAPFRDQSNPRTAAGLLVLSIEERLKQTLERLFRLLGLRYPPKEMYAAYLAVNRGAGEQYAAALEFLDNVLDRELKRILLPLLDDAGNLVERGRALFGVEIRNPEQAIRELIRSGDPWLVACAMAAAGELRFRALDPEIAEAGRNAGPEIGRVALAARAALA